MNRDRDPSRHRTVPEAHIQIVKRLDDEAENWRWESRHDGYQPAEATVKRTSLTQEVMEGKVSGSILLKHPDSIANMEKGTTFAARARAAELNSARAAAAAKEAMTSGGEDEVPELAPMSFRSLKFTRRNARKAARGSKSQDQPVDLSDLPTITSPPNFDLSGPFHDAPSEHEIDDTVHQVHSSTSAPALPSQGSKPGQPAALGGHTDELNQRLIRRKVREVSAKQQSINESTQDEACRQGVHGSTSSSPYSSQGSRASQALGAKKSDLNTQHIREIQRETEKQREAFTSFLQQPRFLTHARYCGDNRPRTETVSTSKSHPIEHKTIQQSFSDIVHIQPKHESSKSDAYPLEFVPVNPQACLNIDKLKTVSHTQRMPPTINELQLHNPQPLSPAQSLPIQLNECGNEMSRIIGPLNQVSYASTSFTPPRHDFDSSRQQPSRSSGSNPNTAERRHVNTPTASCHAANSDVMSQNVGGSPDVHAHEAGRFGLDRQAQSSNDTLFTMQQQYHPQFQTHSQSSGIENQSPYRQQSQSEYSHQTQCAYDQIQNRSSYEQTQNRSTFSQSHPKAMDKFADLQQSVSSSMAQPWDKSNDDPFTDTAQSSSTVTPATHNYAAPAHLRATSPAFIPSMTNSLIIPRPSNPDFVPRPQAKAPLPAVKGTDRDQRFKKQLFRPDVPLNTWSQDEGQFNVSRTSATDFAHIQKRSSSKHGESLHQVLEDKENGHHSQSLTTITRNPPSLRDPMPYTGFSSSASKKEQLLGSLNKTIDDAKAKGDLSTSNRSVLFDPIASSAGSGEIYGASSKVQASDNLTSSISRDRRLKAEAPSFDFPISDSMRATPEYDPNMLKDSEPLPPTVRQQEIETKTLSSPDEEFGLLGHRRGYSSMAPRCPPGLSQSTDPFHNVPISNHDGFWDDSLAVNSGNPAIEEHVRALGCKSAIWAEEQMPVPDLNSNAWIEEQKRLLLPKVRPTNEQLDEAAKAWLARAEGTMVKSVKDILQRSEGLAPLPSGTRYWEKYYELQKPQQVEHIRNASCSRYAPIGSERTHARTISQAHDVTGSNTTNNSRSSTSGDLAASAMIDEQTRKRAAIDVMAPAIANLASYRAGEDPGPLQRYSQPPAWCIDNSEAGRKSFFNDNWGDVPKRVGRDPRYQQTIHEGRSTYFEDPNPVGRREREILSGYKSTPGWGTSRK